MPKTSFRAAFGYILVGVLFIIILLIVMQQFMRNNAARAVSNNSLTGIASEQGQFTLSVTPGVEPIPMNTMHGWIIHLEAAGRPLENAQISIDGGMPAHGHGLPTQPKVTANLGGGNYQVDGFRFQMPGAWQVNFHVTAGNINDAATLTFTVR